MIVGSKQVLPSGAGTGSMFVSANCSNLFWGGGGWSFFFCQPWLPLNLLAIYLDFFSKSWKLQRWTQELSELRRKRQQTTIKAEKPNTSLARKLIWISPPHLLVWTFWLWRLFEFELQVRLCSASKWTQASWPLAVKKRKRKQIRLISLRNLQTLR